MRTSYYDQAPLDEYGLFRQPKWGHLKELHAAIKLCVKPLLHGTHSNLSLGYSQEAHVFKANSGECAAFLINNDKRNTATVKFNHHSYELSPESVSILPDCKTVAFNTAKVITQYGTRSMQTSQKFDSVEQWQEYKEPIPIFDKISFRENWLLEQTSTTKDSSDYLWYTFRFHHDSPDPQSVLKVYSFSHNLHAFVNGVFVGSQHGSHGAKGFTMLEQTVPFKKGTNYVSILSVMTGLPDSGPYLERRYLGLRRVMIKFEEEFLDFTSHPWGYQVGLLGEKRKAYSSDRSNDTQWSQYGTSTHQRLTWYKTWFDAPAGNDPVALNLGSMGKGEAWVNGESIGRYWVSFRTTNGMPSQTWYNVPRSFLKPSGNQLVLMEEENGYPLGISIDTVSIAKVCSHVLDSYPPPVISWGGHNRTHGRRPKIQLRCAPGTNISTILFSSFGTPVGDCESSYAIGSCHSANSRAIVERACLGKSRCTIPVSGKKFNNDPCPGVPKSLLVDAKCT